MKTDSRLKQDVLDELKWEPTINETEIGVIADDGIITLTGNVTSYFQKSAAERAAKRVDGVRAVVEEIKVKLMETSKRSDQEIAQVAIDTLKWNSTIPEDKIKMKVENGWITLEGELQWNYQKKAAESALRDLFGVKGITNKLTIKSKVNPADVKSEIKNAFERSARIDAQNIRVEAEDHKVILKGTVSSIAEKTDADIAAWSAPGVWNVENELTVAEPTLV